MTEEPKADGRLRSVAVWFRDHVLGAVIAALILIGLAGLGVRAITSDDNEDGETGISSPVDGQEVSSPFVAAGGLSELSHGDHVWLAVEAQGGLYPKRPEITALGPWEFEVSESATRFSLALLEVTRADHEKIEGWFQRGEATGDFPGLSLPNSERLDVVSGLVNEG